MKRRTKLILAVAAVAVFWLYGAIHVVYGKDIGVGTCWKVGWSLGDTFVDLDHLRVGESLGDDASPKVLDALDRCKLEPDPGAWSRDQAILRWGLLIAVTLGVIAAIEMSTRSRQRRSGDREG